MRSPGSPITCPSSAPDRRPGEAAADYLRRVERRPDAVRLTGTDAVQAALAEARRDAADARRKAARP